MDKEALFQEFKQKWHTNKEVKAFNKYLGKHAWALFPDKDLDYDEIKKTKVGQHIRNRTRSGLRRGIGEILKAVRRSKEKQEIVPCVIEQNNNGIVLPVKIAGQMIGFVILCGVVKKTSKKMINMCAALVENAAILTQRDLQLEELNKTVRPRAIALSTVHTVHRLMTSTLNLNELLPRVARLTLQVIRANRCSIKLVDKKRKNLLPKTTIDLRRSKAKLKKIKIGKYAPGRAVKKENPMRGETYLAVPMIDEEVVGVITVYDKLNGKSFTRFDEEIMKTLAEQAAIAIKNAQLFMEQEKLTMSSIKCIAQLLQNRPHSTHKAEASFLKLIRIMGRKFNMNSTEIKMLQYAAMLHDAGQISIPEEVLKKRGELTGKEYDMLKTHPLKGADILSNFKPLKPIVPIILYHHENYDGSGYPRGLSGQEIPLAARIMALAGTFEAMITDKPYRKAISVDAAVKEIRKSSGKQFDPKVVDAFVSCIKRKDVRKLLDAELGKKKK